MILLLRQRVKDVKKFSRDVTGFHMIYEEAKEL